MDFVNKDFVDLVHDGKGLFRTEFLGKGGKPFHVAEHDRNLLALTLNSFPLGKDFLREALGEIALDLVQFFIKG